MSLIFENLARPIGRRRRGLISHGGTQAQTGGNNASAFALLMGTVLALLPLVASAAPSAADQIRSAVQARLQQELRAEAARRDWQGLSFEHELDLPRGVAGLTACGAALRLTALEGGDPLQERRRFELVCPGQGGWTVAVNARVEIYLPAVHAKGVIERGQTIAADDVKLERINLGKANRGFYHRVDEVVGLAAKRRLRPNQALSPALLAQAPVVRRGQRVTIVASRDGVHASTPGEALSDGVPGEVIQVRNLSSEKIIDAKVVEAGVVTSTFQAAD